jgi:hypothetical protein
VVAGALAAFAGICVELMKPARGAVSDGA